MQKATPGGTRPQDAGNHAFSFWREAHHRRDRNIVGVSHGGRAHTPVPSCSLPLLQAFCSRGHAAVPESAVTGAEHETFFMRAFCPAGVLLLTGTADAPAADVVALLPVGNVDYDAPRMPRRHGPALCYGRASMQAGAGPCGTPASAAAASAGNFCGEGAFSAPLTACGAFFIDAKGCSRPKGRALSGPPGPVPGFFRGRAALLQPAAGTCSVRLAVQGKTRASSGRSGGERFFFKVMVEVW